MARWGVSKESVGPQRVTPRVIEEKYFKSRAKGEEWG
jgi:hypothetical protein